MGRGSRELSTRDIQHDRYPPGRCAVCWEVDPSRPDAAASTTPAAASSVAASQKSEPNSSLHDPFIQCVKCGLDAHLRCYGLSGISANKVPRRWLCFWCEAMRGRGKSRENENICELCQRKGTSFSFSFLPSKRISHSCFAFLSQEER